MDINNARPPGYFGGGQGKTGPLPSAFEINNFHHRGTENTETQFEAPIPKNHPFSKTKVVAFKI
jgi:hypothetical protein